MTDDVTANKLSMKPDYWRYFAGEAAKGGDCPLYEMLALAIADDPEIQQITSVAKPGQPPANMLFAAVHYILLGGADHPLRLYYSHLLKPGETESPVDGNAFSAFRDFVTGHQTEIESLIASRVTNTNEVRRSSYLRAGYAEIARRTGLPLHIIELGPSAGLNLNWDRYAYEYSGGDGRVLKAGPAASGLVIHSEWRGDTPPPVPIDPPEVAYRIGLELNQVDLSREEDRRWLVALLWPGLPERIDRMRAALAIAVDHQPPIRPGDAFLNLPAELGGAPHDRALIVTHSMVTYQWTDEMRARLHQILLDASSDRPILRLDIEFDRMEKGTSVYPMLLTTYENNQARPKTIAYVHHHGAWIEWKA